MSSIEAFQGVYATGVVYPEYIPEEITNNYKIKITLLKGFTSIWQLILFIYQGYIYLFIHSFICVFSVT